MLAITGTLFCGLAVIAVALEATGSAALLGAVGLWLVSHGRSGTNGHLPAFCHLQ